MQINNAKQNESGEWEFGLVSTQDEVTFLINWAVLDLMNRGLIHLKSNVQSQEVDLVKIQMEGVLQ